MNENRENLEKLEIEDEKGLLEMPSELEDERVSDRFPPKQRLAIELFGRGNKNSEVARIVGMSVKTIEKWKCNPDFKNEIKLYESRRSGERREIILDKVDEMQLEAVTVLHKLLQSDKESVRLKAAETIMKMKKLEDDSKNGAVQVEFMGMPAPAMPMHEIKNE